MFNMFVVTLANFKSHVAIFLFIYDVKNIGQVSQVSPSGLIWPIFRNRDIVYHRLSDYRANKLMDKG